MTLLMDPSRWATSGGSIGALLRDAREPDALDKHVDTYDTQDSNGTCVPGPGKPALHPLCPRRWERGADKYKSPLFSYASRADFELGPFRASALAAELGFFAGRYRMMDFWLGGAGVIRVPSRSTFAELHGAIRVSAGSALYPGLSLQAGSTLEKFKDRVLESVQLRASARVKLFELFLPGFADSVDGSSLGVGLADRAFLDASIPLLTAGQAADLSLSSGYSF